jgi:COP9 signalosome complex subunit 5
MAMHAARGGDLEVMGILQGKVVGRALVVLDAFALPVEGTETRVNAQAEANEFLIDWLEAGSVGGVGHPEHAVGWYHSHPGYGCWLSGVDVATQATQQRWADPFLAVVLDPHRTLGAGRVELGAFRTYPEGYTPPGGEADPATGARYEAVPLAKVEDFGVHCKSYYPLEVSLGIKKKCVGIWGAAWSLNGRCAPSLTTPTHSLSPPPFLPAPMPAPHTLRSPTSSRRPMRPSCPPCGAGTGLPLWRRPPWPPRAA